MNGILYRDVNGEVYSFKAVLDLFDQLVAISEGNVSLLYAPKDKVITFIRPFELPFVFNEVTE